MTYLSKNKFFLNVSKVKIPEEAIKLYNKQCNDVYRFNDIYINYYLKTKFKKFYDTYDMSINDIIENTDKIFIGTGSIIKAEIFNDYDKFMPLAISYLLSYFDYQKIINNELIKTLYYFFFIKNKTLYFLIPFEELLTFLENHINKNIFLTYY